MQQRKVTYRLYPTKVQQSKLSEMLGVHQRLYNKALEQRIEKYKLEKKYISYYDQCKYLTQWRTEDLKLSDVNAQSSQVTLKRLDLAFKAFFRRLKNGEAPGFPRFKAYERFSGWGYKSYGDGWSLIQEPNMRHGRVRLSGIGIIKIRGQTRTEGVAKTAEILHKSGAWYLSVTINCNPNRKMGNVAIGIDWGLEKFATIVDHNNEVTEIVNPRLGRQSAAKIKYCQKSLSRSKKGSNNRKKIVLKIGGCYRKLHNQRKEFLHQTTAAIAKSCAVIGTEQLNIKNMTARGGVRKRGLNREILDTAPGVFLSLLKCKAGEAGIYWVEVPTRMVKPSQTCHRCGVKNKKLLSERRHKCSCGASCGRDENAARVSLNWALFGRPTGQELSEVWSSGSNSCIEARNSLYNYSFAGI